jgi:hypothetical protein
MSEPFKDAEVLDRLYNQWGLSQRGIADFLSCSQAVVSKYMRKHDVDREKSNRDKPPSHRFDSKGKGTPLSTYEVIQHYDGETHHSVYVHRLIAVAIGKLTPSEFVGEMVVHHKSGHGLDNRHENITVMTPGEHNAETQRRRFSK